MDNLHQNYIRWFKEIVRGLCQLENGGFAILMVTLPILERYLREKSRVYESPRLEAPFYTELLRVFPTLSSEQEARNFWQIFRNGLLHQATLSRATTKGITMPAGLLSADAPAVDVDKSGIFLVNPRKFADRVFGVIDSDFGVFEAAGSINHPMPNA